MAWYRSALLSSASRFSAAFTKSCHSKLVTRGSLKDRKKCLIVPQTRWMSSFDKFGTPLPRRNLSFIHINLQHYLQTSSLSV
jgi:hypothetical protein